MAPPSSAAMPAKPKAEDAPSSDKEPLAVVVSLPGGMSWEELAQRQFERLQKVKPVVDRLRRAVQEAKDESSAMKERLDSVQAQLSAREDQVGVLSQKMAQATSEATEWELQAKKLREEVSAKVTAATVVDSHTGDETRGGSMEEEIRRVKAEAKREVEEAHARLTEVIRDGESLNRRQAKVEELLKKHRAELAQTKSQLEAETRGRAAAEEQVAGLRAQLEELQSSVSGSKQQASTASKAAAELTREIESYRSRAEEAESKAGSAQTACDEAKKDAERARAEASASLSEAEAADRLRQDAEDRATRADERALARERAAVALEEQLKTLRERLQSVEHSAAAKRDSLEGEISSLRRALVDATDGSAGQSDASTHETLAKLAVAERALESQRADFDSVRAGLERRVLEATRSLEGAEAEMSRMREAVREAKNAAVSATTQADSARARAETAEAARREAVERNERLVVESLAVSERMQSAETQLTRCKQELEDLRRVYERERGRVRASEQAAVVMRQRLEEAEAKLALAAKPTTVVPTDSVVPAPDDGLDTAESLEVATMSLPELHAAMASKAREALNLRGRLKRAQELVDAEQEGARRRAEDLSKAREALEHLEREHGSLKEREGLLLEMLGERDEEVEVLKEEMEEMKEMFRSQLQTLRPDA
jgi:chromosome segregation ATPase